MATHRSLRARPSPILLLPVLLLAVATAAAASDLGVPGCNGPVNAVLADGDVLYVGGSFSLAGGAPAGGIAAWDGADWTALGSGAAGVQVYSDLYGERVEIPPQVYCLALYQGDLVAGGSFTSMGGVAAASIARWDGAAWHPLAAGMPTPVVYNLVGGVVLSFPPAVYSLAVWQGELFAGGVFPTAGDSLCASIARWDGAQWKRVGQGIYGGTPPRVLTLVADGERLLAGGDFQIAGIRTAFRLAAWNGVWTAVAPTGPDKAVHALLPREGELLVGGEFSQAGGVAAPYLARWDGEAWSRPSAGAPPNPVRALLELDGWVHAGAWALSGGRWVNRLQTDGPVLCLAGWGDGMAFGGKFHVVGPQVGWNVERWPQQPVAVAGDPPPAPRLTGVVPNPLNPAARLDFTLPRPGPATLAVFDARGRRVALLLQEDLDAGEHACRWDGRDDQGRLLPSGVYLARLRTAEGASARKLVLAR